MWMDVLSGKADAAQFYNILFNVVFGSKQSVAANTTNGRCRPDLSHPTERRTAGLSALQPLMFGVDSKVIGVVSKVDIFYIPYFICIVSARWRVVGAGRNADVDVDVDAATFRTSASETTDPWGGYRLRAG